MAEFSAEVFQNEFLPDGGTDVHAIVTVNCAGAGQAGQSGGEVGEIVIVDTSGSMGTNKIQAARVAAASAIDQMLDGTWFAVISGNDQARLAFPPSPEPAMVRMDPSVRAAAKQAVAQFYSDGGTAMGTWLILAARVFASVPTLTQKHAILLTDGENQHETPEQLTANDRRGPRQVPVPTAAASASTGWSRRSAGSRPRCSGPSTSSRARPRWSPSSPR